MERLKERIETFRRALATLDQALTIESPSVLERDGTIQRFEYTFEACWKAIQRFLLMQDGLQCGSPKACFRALGETGRVDSETVTILLAMVDDRNQTVHTYIEEIAAAIHSHLGRYAAAMHHLHGCMAE